MTYKGDNKYQAVAQFDGAMQLYQRKDEWINLSSDDHSDYKAQFFGWERAFDNKKVF